ncbi:UNVERIFIED_CONTAM: hypothetical protein Sradi_5875100 [Sesamum radiatum]|uniref:PDZ domain-containing protein n=1 Tax=Sesamum radiatum TaxID=300843 RepID=A0AAW2KRX7_SESRA
MGGIDMSRTIKGTSEFGVEFKEEWSNVDVLIELGQPGGIGDLGEGDIISKATEDQIGDTWMVLNRA